MTMNPADAMPFSKLMGVRVTAASAQAVEGEIIVREDLCTSGGIMHGGAIMAFADALGAVGAVASLPEGAGGTTTIESKTNFLGAAPVGSTVKGRSLPLKTGRRMSVWQTMIETAEGKPVAVVIQTQLVL
jgi:1,4-dihydroxy-2-naphthoyl-CoA hydrolase